MTSRTWRIAAIASATGPVCGAVIGGSGSVDAIAATISMAWITAAARFDMLGRRLPDALVGPAVIPLAMGAAVQVSTGSPSALTAIAAGAALMSTPLLVAHVIAPAALGFGDVKASAVVGGALGLVAAPIVVAAAVALIGALLGGALFGLATGRPAIAFGPFLVVGAAMSLLFDRLVGDGSP